MKFRLPFLLCCSIFSGCSTLGDNPIFTTTAQLAKREFGSSSGKSGRLAFDPHYHYLQLIVNGQAVYLALGNVDHGTEVWYSAQGEVLRIRNGRMAGIMGTSTEWRNVVLPEFPSWSEIERLKVYRWARRMDIMPGYKYGMLDQLTLHAIAPVASSNLHEIDPSRLAWFEESSNHLPPSRYAVDLEKNLVVYAETCLSQDFCFSWQRLR